MQSKLAGTIIIPQGSYKGNGDAILFLPINNYKICEKMSYIYEYPEPVELQSDEYFPLQASISNWQAIVPWLCNHYDLVEAPTN